MQTISIQSFIKICPAVIEKNAIEVFQTESVSMATPAILKNLNSIDTTTHGGQQSCKVLLSLDK